MSSNPYVSNLFGGYQEHYHIVPEFLKNNEYPNDPINDVNSSGIPTCIMSITMKIDGHIQTFIIGPRHLECINKSTGCMS